MLHRSKAIATGRAMARKLKDVVPRQQFEVAIQAIVGNKYVPCCGGLPIALKRHRRVIARESLNAFRKDVTAGLYGGDYTRKAKVSGALQGGADYAHACGTNCSN